MSFEHWPQGAVWEYFRLICTIPHPSRHEARLREALIGVARQANLECAVDARGNLRIVRPASAGCENAPAILLQGHMDMVPQVAPGVEFDFLNEPIAARAADGLITTGGRTTLGADDGIGVALALALLTDKTLRTGRLIGLFTVEEETGLSGADAVTADFLEGDILINIDSGENFTIGCAGGGRVEGEWCPETEPPAAELTGAILTVDGLHGGHSGEAIQYNYGNANRILAELLSRFPAFRVAALDGGTVDNAIPSRAAARGAGDEETLRQLAVAAAELEKRLRTQLEAASAATVTLTAAARPEKVWSEKSVRTILTALLELPNGRLGILPDGVTETSSNLATLETTEDGRLIVCVLSRSLYNSKRAALSEALIAKLRRHGATAALKSSYSGWSPKPDSPFLARSQREFRRIFGREASVAVIHGGLECGIFSGVRPELEMLSIAPVHENIHTPDESLSIASTEKVLALLRALVTVQ